MSDQERVLQNVQNYSQTIKSKEYATPSWVSKKAQEARVEKTIRELQDLVKAQKEAIEQLRSLSGNDPIQQPAEDLSERLQQLRTIKLGYEKLAAKDPLLPTSDSALPSLLALRHVSKVVSEDKAHLPLKQEELAQARERLARQEAYLRRHNLLTESLTKRIEELRQEHSEKSARTPEEEAKLFLDDERRRRLDHVRNRKALTRTLVNFINDPLAGMLAAEDLGGPVVGDLPEVTDEMLEAGFSQLGKPKKHKPLNAEKRRRRIREIWGTDEDDGDEDAPSTEREAAARHMRELVEELLNVAAESGAEGKYVDVKKDSAAVRFLVRANVAEFDPEDARKLRLIDFVSEFEDVDITDDTTDDI